MDDYVTVDRNTVYALAWDILRLPPGNAQEAARERVRVKRSARAYANSMGWDLFLIASTNGVEEWMLNRPGQRSTRPTFGTLQECCLKIVEHETQPGWDGDTELQSVKQGLTTSV